MKHVFTVILLIAGCSKPLTESSGFIKHLYSRPLPGASITSIYGSVALNLQTANVTDTLFTIGTTPITDCNMNGDTFYTYDQIWVAHPQFQSIQSIILKQAVPGTNAQAFDFDYPGGRNNQGCLVYIIDSGPPTGSSIFTNSIDISVDTSPDQYLIDVGIGTGAEFCYGQDWGCQIQSLDNTAVFAHAEVVPRTSILETMTGDVASSSLNGSPKYGPAPTGPWTVSIEYYTIPGGCGPYIIGNSIISPALQGNTIRLFNITQSGVGIDQATTIVNQAINTQLFQGDCLLYTVARTGDGALDVEHQVNFQLRSN